MVLICAHADLSRTVQIIRFRPDGIKSSFITAKFRLNLCQVKAEINLDLHSWNIFNSEMTLNDLKLGS